MSINPARDHEGKCEAEAQASVFASSIWAHQEFERRRRELLKLQEIVIAPLPHKFGLPQSLATNMMGREASGGSSEVIAKSWLTSTIAARDLMVSAIMIPKKILNVQHPKDGKYAEKILNVQHPNDGKYAEPLDQQRIDMAMKAFFEKKTNNKHHQQHQQSRWGS